MTTITATRHLYRPAGSLKVTCKVTGAVAFIGDRAGRLFAIGYLPKATRNSAFHYGFKSAAARDKHVADFFAGVVAREARRAADRAARSAPHTLQVGHVFVASWGYEQTNKDFYQVVEIVGKNSVRVRAIGSSDVTAEGRGTHDSGYCLPSIDAFKGEAMLKRVSMAHGGPRITIDDCRSARLWDGKPEYYSWGY